MLWIVAIILGIVEGLTEFIPVSSTGHLLLAEHFLTLNGQTVDQTFFGSEVFNAVIQVGAMLAALPLFSDRLATLKRWQDPATQSYFLKMGLSFGITVVGALIMKKLGLQLPHEITPIAIALLVGGILFVAVEFWLNGRSTTSEVSWALAIAFGVGQLIAVAFPGSSRSGSTILLALILGMARGPAVEFSFLLGVPTLCAAGVKTLWDAHKTHEVILWGPLIVTTIVAAICSVLAVRWMLGYVRNHTFNSFGYYRILIGIVLLVIAFTGFHA